MDSVFRVLEPVVERITEKAKAPAGFGRFAFGNTRSEWFRVFRVNKSGLFYLYMLTRI
jgi:RHO1 GDP-GTP exchange protein 1/2